VNIPEWVQRKEVLLEEIEAYASQVSQLKPTPMLSAQAIRLYLEQVQDQRDKLVLANYEEFLEVNAWWEEVQGAKGA